MKQSCFRVEETRFKGIKVSIDPISHARLENRRQRVRTNQQAWLLIDIWLSVFFLQPQHSI